MWLPSMTCVIAVYVYTEKKKIKLSVYCWEKGIKNAYLISIFSLCIFQLFLLYFIFWEKKKKTYLLVSSTTVASINSVDLSLTITWQSSPSASGDLINLPTSKRQWAKSKDTKRTRRKWKTINYMIGVCDLMYWVENIILKLNCLLPSPFFSLIITSNIQFVSINFKMLNKYFFSLCQSIQTMSWPGNLKCNKFSPKKKLVWNHEEHYSSSHLTSHFQFPDNPQKKGIYGIQCRWMWKNDGWFQTKNVIYLTLNLSYHPNYYLLL